MTHIATTLYTTIPTYVAVKIVLTNASTATSYVGMIENIAAKLCMSLQAPCFVYFVRLWYMYSSVVVEIAASTPLYSFDFIYSVKQIFKMTFKFWLLISKCYSLLPMHSRV